MIETSEEHHPNIEPAVSEAKNRLPEHGENHHHARGLLAIGLFKLSKALFFLVVGLGALHLVHRNIGDVMLSIAAFFRLDTEGRFFGMLQDRADLISGHQLRQFSLATLGYSALSTVEGVGLMMEKTWAEYLTLTLTIGALPFDLTELIRHTTLIRASVVFINLAVLAYLLWFIRWHRQQKRAHAG